MVRRKIPEIGISKIAVKLYAPQINVLILRPYTPITTKSVLQASPHHPTGFGLTIRSAFAGDSTFVIECQINNRTLQWLIGYLRSRGIAC